MEKQKYYRIDEDKDGKWKIMLGIGRHNKVMGDLDEDMAHAIAVALNDAYRLGMADCEEQVKERVVKLLFG